MSRLFTGVAVVITFTVTFIVSVTATAIITFILAYMCVKRTLEKTANITTHNPNDPIPQEVCLPSHTFTMNDSEPPPEPPPDPGYRTLQRVQYSLYQS